MSNLLGTGKQLAGKNSKILVDNTVMNHSSWLANYRTGDIDLTNFDSATNSEGIKTLNKVELSFGGDWDALSNPYDDPPGLFPRDDLPNLKFYHEATGTVLWDFEFARIRSASNGAEVRGKINFSCSGMSQGAFLIPAG